VKAKDSIVAMAVCLAASVGGAAFHSTPIVVAGLFGSGWFALIASVVML
jgi:hypothetical protein